MKKIITIDGGAGTGKTTVGRKVAEKQNLTFISTGKIFRVIAYLFKEKIKDVFGSYDRLGHVLKCLVEKTDYNVETFVKTKDIKIENNQYTVGKVIIQDEKLNNEEIAQLASKLSEIKEVREIYEKIIKREIKNSKDQIVMDGRDCGTVICPETKFKFFLTCSPEAAAEHRMKDYKGKNVLKAMLIEDINKRNKDDQTRKLSPCIPADDAIVIDTSSLTVNEVVDKVNEYIKNIEKAENNSI